MGPNDKAFSTSISSVPCGKSDFCLRIGLSSPNAAAPSLFPLSSLLLVETSLSLPGLSLEGQGVKSPSGQVRIASVEAGVPGTAEPLPESNKLRIGVPQGARWGGTTS